MRQRFLSIAGVLGLLGVGAGLAGYRPGAVAGAVAMLLMILLAPWMER